MPDNTFVYDQVAGFFALTFVIFYVAAAVPGLLALRLYGQKRCPSRRELVIDSICNVAVLLGIFLGLLFQVQLAEQPFGTVYGGYATQLFVLLAAATLFAALYYAMAYRRFRQSR